MAQGDEEAGATERLADVRRHIVEATKATGRTADSVILVAVSKTFDAEHILPVLEAGQRVFGENRVQEAMAKWPALKEKYANVELHLIGPLQSNKAREAVALFDVIHTVDRPKIAHALAAEMKKQGRTPRLLIEVNTGEEPQKAGVKPDEIGALLDLCRNELGLRIDGLMCIPPQDEEAAVHFALLAKLAQKHGLEQLSMGMSSDYEAAVRFGATMVRVGSAIFGARA